MRTSQRPKTNFNVKHRCRFMDSCGDHYFSEFEDKWDAIGSASITANGRNGRGIQTTAFGPTKVFQMDPNTSNWKWSHGGAYRTNLWGGAIYKWSDVILSNADIVHRGDGTLFWNIGVRTRVIPNFLLKLNKFYYLEWVLETSYGGGQLTVNNEFWVNGVLIDSWDSDGPFVTATRFFNIFSPSGPGGGGTAIWDDIYVNDNQGSKNIDRWGDTVIGVIRPNGEGYLEEMNEIPADGVHFNKINDYIPDSSNYLYGERSGTEDFFIPGPRQLQEYENVNPALLPKAAQVCTYAKKFGDFDNPDVGIVFKNIFKDPSSTVLAQGFTETAVALGDDPTYILTQYDDNPITGLDWTGISINSGQWGTQGPDFIITIP